MTPWCSRVVLRCRSATNLAARVVQVTDKELVIDATGATSDTSINIARYSPSGGWQYIAPLLAEHQEGNRITAPIPKLEAAEYLVILRNPDGSQSPPSRFVVSTGADMRCPSWRMSTGGSPSGRMGPIPIGAGAFTPMILPRSTRGL